MSQIQLGARFEDADAFYAGLVEALEAAGEIGAQAFLGRLVLLLANQIGDAAVLMEALAQASDHVDAARCGGWTERP